MYWIPTVCSSHSSWSWTGREAENKWGKCCCLRIMQRGFSWHHIEGWPVRNMHSGGDKLRCKVWWIPPLESGYSFWEAIVLPLSSGTQKLSSLLINYWTHFFSVYLYIEWLSAPLGDLLSHQGLTDICALNTGMQSWDYICTPQENAWQWGDILAFIAQLKLQRKQQFAESGANSLADGHPIREYFLRWVSLCVINCCEL